MLKPLGDRVVVTRKEGDDVTDSGIYIAGSGMQQKMLYTVISVSPSVTDVSVGDTVAMGEYVGDEIEIDGETICVVDVMNILGVVCES